jgi:hypothetical protein
MLGRFLVMAQAAFLDRQFFDLLPPCNDGRVTPEVDIGGRNVAKALVVAMVAIEKLHGTKVNKNKIRVKPAK